MPTEVTLNNISNQIKTIDGRTLKLSDITKKLDNRIKKLEDVTKNLDKKIDKVDIKLTKKIDELEKSNNKQFLEINKRFWKLETKLGDIDKRTALIPKIYDNVDKLIGDIIENREFRIITNRRLNIIEEKLNLA